MKASPVLNAQSVERLRHLIESKAGYQRHLRSAEPDWNNWVRPLELSPDKAEELVVGLKRLWLLPFADFPAAADLLIFRYSELPEVAKRSAQRRDRLETELCALFELLVGMALQGFSAFPQNPAQLAGQVCDALRHPRRKRDHLLPLLELLIHRDTALPDTGFNSVWLQDPDFIVVAEHMITGNFDTRFVKDANL
jgi:hypothetical protein